MRALTLLDVSESRWFPWTVRRPSLVEGDVRGGGFGLAGVGEKAWRREVQEGGELESCGFGGDGIAEADVDLDCHLCVGDPRQEYEANASVTLALAYGAACDGRIEDDSVVHRHRGDALEELAQVCFVVVAPPEQVDVTRCAVRLAEPSREEGRALQDEA